MEVLGSNSYWAKASKALTSLTSEELQKNILYKCHGNPALPVMPEVSNFAYKSSAYLE
jgi:hypothetical protein